MRSILFAFIASLSWCIPNANAQHHLYKIAENNRVGYIDEQGRVVIKPTFLNGSDFSEGLAAVRSGGLFGYIDTTGRFVLPEKYDAAQDFHSGIALVHVDGKPLIIDENGTSILGNKYQSLSFMDDQKAIVTTEAGRKGILNVATRELVTDTMFGFIEHFPEGVFITRAYDSDSYDHYNYSSTALLDSGGKIIVPTAQISGIEGFENGYAKVRLPGKNEKEDFVYGFIDTKGRVIYRCPDNKECHLGVFHDGLAIYELRNYIKNIGYLTESRGFINTKGALVNSGIPYLGFDGDMFNDKTGFYCGRYFIRDRNGAFYMIDKKINRITQDAYQEVSNFKNGYATVNKGGKWGIIDTNGTFIVSPQYGSIKEVNVTERYFFFSTGEEKLYGIADFNGNVLVKPTIERYDSKGFADGILKVTIDDKLSYINKEGRIIWQEKDAPFSDINIDFMRSGYYYFCGKNRKIKKDGFKKNTLSIVIDTNKTDTFVGGYRGYRLYIANTTADTAKLASLACGLELTLQAINSKGEWECIEYIDAMDGEIFENTRNEHTYHRIGVASCGQDPFETELEPNSYFNFIIPKYSGAMNTQIRAALVCIDHGSTKLIYSNVINASVNPGQFWNNTWHHIQLLDYPR